MSLQDTQLNLPSPEYTVWKAIWQIIDASVLDDYFSKFYRMDDEADQFIDFPPDGALPALRLSPSSIDERWMSPQFTEHDFGVLCEIWSPGWHIGDVFGLRKLVKDVILDRDNNATLEAGGAWLLAPEGAVAIQPDSETTPRILKLSWSFICNVQDKRLI